MVSVVIPYKNDSEILYQVLDNLNYGLDLSGFEIVVVNDGSKWPCNKFRQLEIDSSKYPNVVVVDTPMARGVGYSFDRGVEKAQGDTIVIMGCDVFPKRELWLGKVMEAVHNNPNSLGCAVCVGSKVKYYGADLLITIDKDDLPEYSKLRDRAFYTEIFKGRWRKDAISDKVCSIGCLMGAFYFTSKKYYQYIGGWDTDPNEKWQGHRTWGSLEPTLSLKSWLVGGGCYLYPDIEALHLFNRKGEHRFSKGSRGLDDMWWNAVWVLETMVMDSAQRDKIYNFLHPELNLNRAKINIRKHYDNILKIRKRNELIFTHNLSWFMDKFGYKIK